MADNVSLFLALNGNMATKSNLVAICLAIKTLPLSANDARLKQPKRLGGSPRIPNFFPENKVF